MFVPALANKKSGEVGHPNYQHPQRLREGIYNAEVDRYPLLVVATALKALSVGGRELWDRYDNGDNLLFRETDLKTPAKSKLFQELRELPAPQVRTLIQELTKATERNLEDVPAIDELLPETRVAGRTSASVLAPIKPTDPAAEVLGHAEDSPRFVETSPVDPKRKGKKGGVPMWALIGGGAAAAVLLGIVVVAGIVWSALNTSKPAPPIAQKKGGDDGIKVVVKVAVKDAKPTPPIKDGDVKPVDPDKGKPPIVKPPPPVDPTLSADRKPLEVIGEANWHTTGEELRANAMKGASYIYFGSKEWIDYDFSFDTTTSSGSQGAIAMFRAADQKNYYGFSLGALLLKKSELFRVRDGGFSRFLEAAGEVHNLNQWYKVRIEVRGIQFLCYLDGRKLFEYKNDNHASGAVGFGLKQGSYVRWKNIKLTAPDGKPLWNGLPDLSGSETPPPPVVAADAFVPLFNGKDSTGWKTHPQMPGNWNVKDGVLTGDAGALYTTRGDYADFHLVAEARINDGGLGSLFSRSPFDSMLPASKLNIPYGFQAFISGVPRKTSIHETGTLRLRVPKTMGMGGSGGPVLKLPGPGEWFKLEVVAEGNVVKVKVNGIQTGNAVDKKSQFMSGHIVLFAERPGTVLEFRKIEIKEMNVAKPPPPVVDAEGFVPLFNGKDLAGWKLDAKTPGVWRVQDGILIGSADARGRARMQTDRVQPKDFHLRVVARTKEKGLGAVCLRAPEGSPASYEASINALKRESAEVGRLVLFKPDGGVRFLPPVPKALFRPEPDDWFTPELIVKGDHLVAKVNGTTTTDGVDATLSEAGHLGLAVYSPTAIEFRTIEIKELSVAKPPPVVGAEAFVPIFNGKDLDGWKLDPKDPDRWRVIDGILTGNKLGNNTLYTARDDYKDFHLRLEARLKPGTMGEVKFRQTNDFQGYETTIGGKTTGRTSVRIKQPGNAPSLVRALCPASKEPIGEWILLEIIAEGNRFHLKVDGKTTAEFVDANNNFLSGQIALQEYAKGTVEYRKIEIKELKAAAGAVVDQEQLVIDNNTPAAWIGGNGRALVSQIVTANSSGRLVEVRLPIRGGKRSLTLEIRGVTAGLPNETVLTAETIPAAKLPGLMSATKDFQGFILTKPISVTKGQSFAIVLSASDFLMITAGPVGDPYAGGDGCHWNTKNNRWLPLGGGRKDLPFQTLIERAPGP